jgi:pimeloyl-ACP methyl ester carboxylesterase
VPTTNHRGCDIAYSVTGDGPPVLFVQGVGVHGDGWRPQIGELSSRFTCIAFDNRGMGRSQPSGESVSVELMAEDVRAVLDATGFEAAHVVGHSLGGLVALVLALEHRARVASLALLCTFARGRDAAPPTPRMIWTGMRTRIGARAMRRRAFLELVLPPGALREVDTDALASRLEPLFGHDLADQPPIVSAQLAAMRRCDPSPRLGELAGLSALVVSAEHDPIAPPAAGRRLAGLLPDARYVELSDASHGVPIEQPTRINVLLAEHLTAAT